jgi:hypothetical protein
MPTIAHSWQSLSDTFEARASEWALAGAMLCLGLVSALNADLFTDPAFRGLTDWASQPMWALGFLTVGILRLIVLLVNGAYWRTPQFRCLFAFISAGVWFQLLLGFAANLSFFLAFLPWIFGLDVYNAVRAGREAGIGFLFHRYHQEGMKSNGGPAIAKH